MLGPKGPINGLNSGLELLPRRGGLGVQKELTKEGGGLELGVRKALTNEGNGLGLGVRKELAG